MGRDKKTEDKIVKAAEKVFQDEGFAGARMQKIADKAKINKGLLHYYFKTKEKLFLAIFEVAMNKFLGKVSKELNAERPLLENIRRFVSTYLDIISKNAYLPPFVVSELNKHPDKIIDRVLGHKNRPNIQPFKQKIREAVERGEIVPIDPDQLIINIISLCIFPYVGRPLMQVLLEHDKKSFHQLLEQRKDMVADFVIRSIQPQQS